MKPSDFFWWFLFYTGMYISLSAFTGAVPFFTRRFFITFVV